MHIAAPSELTNLQLFAWATCDTAGPMAGPLAAEASLGALACALLHVVPTSMHLAIPVFAKRSLPSGMRVPTSRTRQIACQSTLHGRTGPLLIFFPESRRGVWHECLGTESRLHEELKVVIVSMTDGRRTTIQVPDQPHSRTLPGGEKCLVA